MSLLFDDFMQAFNLQLKLRSYLKFVAMKQKPNLIRWRHPNLMNQKAFETLIQNWNWTWCNEDQINLYTFSLPTRIEIARFQDSYDIQIKDANCWMIIFFLDRSDYERLLCVIRFYGLNHGNVNNLPVDESSNMLCMG